MDKQLQLTDNMEHENPVRTYVILISLHWTISNLCKTIQMFGVTKIFNTFIQQGRIKLIKSDRKDFYIDTKKNFIYQNRKI